MIEQIRNLVSAHGRLRVPVKTLHDSGNLWSAGMASFAAVQLMLALEEAFEIEFPAPNRSVFESIDAIATEVTKIMSSKVLSTGTV